MESKDEDAELAELDDFDVTFDTEEAVNAAAFLDPKVPEGDDEGDDEGGDEGDDEGDDEDTAPEETLVYSPLYGADSRADSFARRANTERIIELVPPAQRITDNRLHQTEAARIIAVMAKQIADYPHEFTDCSGLSDPVDRAKKHLMDRKCFLRLRRFMGPGARPNIFVYEEWIVNEMVLPPFKLELGRRE